MPVSSCTSAEYSTSASACATRSGLALPWPVPSSVPEPFDLKWFAATRNASSSLAPTALKPWKSGSRALSNRSEEHTSELQSRENLVCRLLLEQKKPSVQTTLHLY